MQNSEEENERNVLTFDIVSMGQTCLKVDGDEVFRVNREAACSKCGFATVWVSVSFHGHYCSSDCLNQEWKDFEEANK